MSIRFQEEVEQSETQDWLTTYADMITLLLTFFVMLLGMSSVDRVKFEQAAGSIKSSLGYSQTETRMRTGDIGHQPTVGLEDQGRQSSIRTIISRSPESRFIKTRFTAKKITITVDSKALFAPGSADLMPGGRKALDKVIDILKTFPEYKVHIGGHTDAANIRTARYPSNWELSAIRATTVLRYLYSKGIPAGRMTATGYADINPVAPNDTPANRALNRRVEFVLEKE